MSDHQQTERTHDADAIAEAWLSDFGAALDRRDFDAVGPLFAADGWWRDLLALTWDLRTLHGAEAVKSVLAEHLERAGMTAFRLKPGKRPLLTEGEDGTATIEVWIEFATAVADGHGIVRLQQDDVGAWKAWTLLTAMQELHGHEPAIGDCRRTGLEEVEGEGEDNWLDARRRKHEFLDADPRVLIVGAGQSGLAAAAQLSLRGVDTLVVETNARVGDNWRKRYHSLVLHDPVWANHLPYMPFPSAWPVYTPKDKLGDWLESYATTLELNVWTGTSILDGSYDEATGRWTVRLRRADGTERTVRPAHVVLATGVHGKPSVVRFPGDETFKGQLLHSSQYDDAKGWAGGKAIVVGAGNSGHDIAQDFCEQGADVTLVQRSSTYVFSRANGIPTYFGGLYYEDGPPTEEADLLGTSMPLLAGFPGRTQIIAELDRELHEGLSKVGYVVDEVVLTPENVGTHRLLVGKGYYIDVGCAQLIIDGKVKVKNAGLESFTETGVLFDDGTSLDADVVVLAVGYSNMRETARGIFGDAVADRLHTVFGHDQEGELRTVWRDSGHPGFWFAGGALHQVRPLSRYLALQIKAIEEGIHVHPSAAVPTATS
jgi:cation diffusion facilitator CzcD-associated flavoprotein CzcO